MAQTSVQVDITGKGRVGWKKEIWCNSRDRSYRRTQAEYRRM